MKYLNKTIEYGLYLLVFLLPIQTRWIIKAGELNGGPWEYGTYSLYATDILLILLWLLFIVYKFLEWRITNYPPSLKLRRTSELPPFAKASEDKRITNYEFNTKYKIQNLLIFGLTLVSAISVLFAPDKFLALYKFGWLILGLGLFWLTVRAAYNSQKLIYALFAGMLLEAGLGVWQFLSQAAFANKWLGLAAHRAADLGASVVLAAGVGGVGERWLRAYGGLDHPNILGGLLAIGIILLISEIIREEKFSNINPPYPPLKGGLRGVKFFLRSQVKWLPLIFFTAALFFSFSRSAWLALALGLAAMIARAVAGGNLKSQKGLAEIILVMGILLLVLSSQYQNLVVARFSGEGRLENKSNSERLASYQESWQLIKNNWLFGAGLGNYGLANYKAKIKLCLPAGQAGETAKMRNCEKISSYDYQPAHNVFLLAFSEIGIFGLIFFIGLLFFIARSSIVLSFWRERQRPIESREKRTNREMLSLPPAQGRGTLQHDRKETRLFRLEQSVGARHDGKAAILIALVVLLSLDHWLWSLHFGVWFFWLILGVTAGSKRDKELISI